MLLGVLTTIGCRVFNRTGGIAGGEEAMDQKDTKTFLKLHPVGRVDRKVKSVKLRIYDRYSDAPRGLDGFSHPIVLYWFDRNDTQRNVAFSRKDRVAMRRIL
jgi:tRNA (Thr-GGU) A37 N-methylase